MRQYQDKILIDRISYVTTVLCLIIFISCNNLNALSINKLHSFDNENVSNGEHQQQSQQQQQSMIGCSTDRLAIYKVVLHTYWTRDLFPKHYPDWRPPAQWTKTVGRSHDASYNLFSLTKSASAGMKVFAETGRSDILDQMPAGADENIFDEFNLPAILSGSGRSEGKFFVDGNHSLVSLATRIVPSPDWFVGVDAFQLCIGGSWIDSLTIELDPLDAGTDNGFTFTAPNWATDPQGIIYRITSHYPAHPAGSFYYPQNKRLPPIATFQFIKYKEYELSEVFSFTEDDRKYSTLHATKTHLEKEHNQMEMNNELSANIERERQYEMIVKPLPFSEKDRIRAKLLAKLNPLSNITSSSSSSLSSSTTTPIIISSVNADIDSQEFTSNSIGSIEKVGKSSSTSLSSPSSSYLLPKNDKTAILNQIAHSYASKKNKKRILRPPKDCRVGHWSQWSSCSKTCGIGEMQRNRKVINHAKRGGRRCPPLQESKWCGSARDCNASSEYFKW